MARRFSLPFKTLVGSELEPQPWHYRIGGDWLRIQHGEGIPGWDYLSDLEFSREIRIDGDRARGSCGLGPATALELAVTLVAPACRLRTVVFRCAVPHGESVQVASFAVPSTELADSIRLETEVLLSAVEPTDDEFSPTMPGSRLYSDSVVVMLEGTRSRMPIELASFASQLPWLNAPLAPWYVFCGGGDLHAPVMRDLRVYLNVDQPRYAESARAGEPLIVGLISADVAATIIMMALEDPDFLSGSTDYAEESMGAVSTHLFSVCFPSSKRSDIAQQVRENPARFSATIRSAMVNTDG